MPKKKTTVIEEEVPEVKYEDVHDKDMSEVIKDSEPENPIETKAKEIKETPKEEEPKEEVEEVKFDAEKFQEETIEKVSKATADKITRALGGEETTDVQKDKYQEIADKFTSEKGRPPTWHELVPFIVEEAKASIKADQEKYAQDQAEKDKQLKEIESENLQKVNEVLDEELTELYASNKLPKIVDKEDQNDPGIVARKALFQTMLEVNAQREKEGKPLIYSVHRIFNNYYKAPGQPAGADAPVSVGDNKVGESPSTYTYKDIKRPWSEIISGLWK